MSNLWEKTSYKSPIQFLVDTNVREYDISKANINVLRDANVVSEEQYQYYYQCPKDERSVAIGKMQGFDSRVTDILKEGIANARRVFIESNKINDSEILAIRNDAITIIGNRPIVNLDVTSRVHFRMVGSYTSFYHVNTIDLFYLYDRISNTELLDVKGLGDFGAMLHKDYMLDFLSLLFYTAQINGIKDAIYLLQTVYQNYINKSLSIEYYRELNPLSKYKLSPEFSMYSSLYMDYATERDKKILDIGFNENILRYFNRIYASIYFGLK